MTERKVYSPQGNWRDCVTSRPSPTSGPMLKFLRPALLSLGILSALATALRAEKPFSFADTPGQLPKTAVPRH